MKIKVFNLMSRTNEAHYMSWHETCACKCKLDATVCNCRQRWNNDKCRCECKELIEKGKCNDGFMRKPSTFECEYMDYMNCKCRKRLTDKLVEKYEMVYNVTLHDFGFHNKVCRSCI